MPNNVSIIETNEEKNETNTISWQGQSFPFAVTFFWFFSFFPFVWQFLYTFAVFRGTFT